MLCFLSNLHSNINLVINIAANKEVRIPMISVVANPWIGPDPKRYKDDTKQQCGNIRVDDG